MPDGEPMELDLMPPEFAEGLADWSRGDGAPESETYEWAENVRLARGDPDFGVCLELRKVDAIQKVRYMGELPVLAGRFLQIAARIKAVRGPLPRARIAAWPGGVGASVVPGLADAADALELGGYETVHALRAVIGPEALPGVDLVWDERVLYAHVGVDILGPEQAVIRLDRICVTDVTADFLVEGPRSCASAASRR